MDKRFIFTQARIRSIKPPEKGVGAKHTVRDEYYDTTQPKLALRVSDSGNKSFIVLKKDQSGVSKRITIGRFPDFSVDQARKAAGKILEEVNSGIDPILEKRKMRARSQTLQELLDAYIKDHDLRTVTENDYRQKMKWGFEDWLTKSASKITESMILSRHKRLTGRGKTATNGAFRPLRAVFNYAITIKAVNHNPVAVLSAGRLWHKERRRTDIIRPEQLGEWLQAVDLLNPEMHRVAFKMFLYMGFRVTETYKVEWKDVDLKNGLIVQRDTKNRTDHELPIPNIILPEIVQLKTSMEEKLEEGEKLSPFMFPAVKRGTFHGRPKIQIAALNKNLSFRFSPHMARHTFTTICEAVGIPKTMIDRLTNHTMTSDVTSGYIHTETETLREAINRVGAYIQQYVVTDKGGIAPNVVRLHRQVK